MSESSVDKFLNRMKDVDGLHRWIDERHDDEHILCLSYREGTHSYACTGNLEIALSNYMLDVYKNYLINCAFGDDDNGDHEEGCDCERT